MAVLLVAFLALLAGCLGKPGIEERWTLLEMLEFSPPANAIIDASGGNIQVSVKGRVTFRQILSGFMVAELRYSPLVTPADVKLDPERQSRSVARDVDLILENSVTAGRATQGIVGFNHLIREVDLQFDGTIPSEMTAGGGAPVGGLFLVFYMGDGEEVELQDGSDSLVVTPFLSNDYDILSTGLELDVLPGGASKH